MELLVIAVVVGIFIFSFPVWVISKINLLNAEVSRLKSQMQGLSQTDIQPASQSESAAAPLSVAQQGTFAPRAVQPMYQPKPLAGTNTKPVATPPNAFVAWLTEDIFMKLGAVLLLLGFGWFVSYAFMNNWIEPVGRISLGVLAGVAIMGAGTWRIKEYRHQGGVLLVLGSGIVLLTLFAAREMYEFLTPAISLVVMFLSVAYVAFVSVLYKSDALALAGLVMAAIAPLLTNPAEPSILGLMSYLLIVVVGTVWVVRLTGSHTLTFASVVMMLLYSLPFLDGSISVADERIALFFSFIFAAIFFATNTLSIIKIPADAARKGQIYTALFTGAYLFFWIQLVISPTMQSLAYVFWMLVFSVGSFVVYTQTTNRTPFFMYAAVTAGLLFGATAAELAGPVLTIALTLEIMCLLLLARQTIANQVSEKLLWVFALPVVLSLDSFASSSWNSGFFHADFVTLLVVGAALGVVGIVYAQTREAAVKATYWSQTLISISFIYLLRIIWLVFASVLPNDEATAGSLIIYTLLGLSLLVAGRIKDNRYVQILAGMLLGGVVLRLLIIDVWQMDLVGRIITFFVIGTLLISTAFIGKAKKEQHETV